VRGVEVGGLLRVEVAGGDQPFSVAAEHAHYEISVAQIVPEPSVLCHWKVRPPFDEHSGKDADAVLRRRFIVPEDLDPLNTAARRGLLEDEAVEAGLSELVDLVTGVALHSLGQNLAGDGLDQLWFGITTLELDCGPWHPETDLELGADRHPVEPLTEDVGEIPVALVPAVKTHLGAEQAR